MPHLLLVSHNYHPEPTGIRYYHTDMAEWFVQQGWRVSVTTGLPHSVSHRCYYTSHGVIST